MIVLSIAGFGISSAAKKEGLGITEEQTTLVTSFYPMYILAKNLTVGTDTIVSNLTENQTGCLHDYQLTTRDMKLLSAADILVINGAEMELFLDEVIKNYPNLPVIETSVGVELLEGLAHDHTHAHADEDTHTEEDTHTDEDAHTDEEEAYNGHVWMDVERYRLQAKNLYEGLTRLDATQADSYREAYETYDMKLMELSDMVKKLASSTKGVPVVLFHEAFSYLADSLGMIELKSIAMDEEVVPSAGEIAEVIQEIKYHGGALILIEKANATHAEKIVAESNAIVVYLDSLTTGTEDVDSYLIKMQENIQAIEAGIAEWEQL